MELISDKISKSLNISNEVTLVPEVIDGSNQITQTPDMSVASLKREGEVQSDYEFAREKIRGVATAGAEVLQNALTVGSDSSNPRLIEAASALMAQITSASKELLETQKSMQGLTGSSGGIQIQNNTVYVGTAKDLLEMVKKAEQEK